MGMCCANQMSAFCPECGANLKANPLAALLSHCRRQAVNYEQQAERGSERMVNAAIKWRSWTTALETLFK